MSMAFGISPDDVSTVVEWRFGRRLPCDHPVAEQLFDMLDDGAVEKAALRGDDMDDQTEGAHEEIERQLRADPEALALVESLPARA